MAKLVGDIEAGAVLPGHRSTPDGIADEIAALRLHGGAADVPAYFDYSVLSMAFDRIWRPQLDADLVEAASELFHEVIVAGGEPRILMKQGVPLCRALCLEANSILSAGLHAVQAFAADTTDIADLDLPPDARRIRAQVTRRSAPMPLSAPVVRDHRQDSPDVRDHRQGGGVVVVPSRPARSSTTPGGASAPPHGYGEATRLAELVKELEQRLGEPYSFDVFAADGDDRSANFGLLATYRQRWAPVSYQVGTLVKTETLAPREEKTYTTRRTWKSSTTRTRGRQDESQQSSETTVTNRDATDIVNAAKSSLGYRAEGRADFDIKIGSAGGSESISRDTEKSSQETRQAIREAVRKAAQEHRASQKVDVTTSESSETSSEETGKIVNPNDEIPVTYLFYELQRRYRVSEAIHRLTPVVLVAQEVPAPHEITRAWILHHDWILANALLDQSFGPALLYLSTEAAGAEIKLAELKVHLDTQRKLVDRLEAEIEALHRDTGHRYLALENSMMQRAAATGDEESEGWLEKGMELFFGESSGTPEAAQVREDAARDAYDRALRAERDAKDRLDRAVSALEVATEEYVAAQADFETKELGVLRLRVHVKQNILHYMQAIWDMEQHDQRVYRLHATPVPRLQGQIEYTLVPDDSVPPVPPLWRPSYKMEACLQLEDPAEMVPLGDLADLDRPLGYRGNYAIFPLRRHNAFTKFLSVPYADARAGLHDPDDAANFTLTDLDEYVACLREHLSPAEFDQIRPQIVALYTYVLQQPFPDEEEIVVPSGSLFIEALPGSAPVLEDFKLLHRAVDVTRAGAEVRSRELENLRYAARLLGGKLQDPEVERQIVVEGGNGVATPSDS